MSLIPNDEDRARQAGFTQGAAMAEAENARLRADNDRLRGLLREALPFVKWSGIASARDVRPRIEAALAESGHESGQNGLSAADQPAAVQTVCGASGVHFTGHNMLERAADQPDAAP